MVLTGFCSGLPLNIRWQFYLGQETDRDQNKAGRGGPVVGPESAKGGLVEQALSDSWDIPLLCSEANNGSHSSRFVPNNPQSLRVCKHLMCNHESKKQHDRAIAWTALGCWGQRTHHGIKYADRLYLKMRFSSFKRTNDQNMSYAYKIQPLHLRPKGFLDQTEQKEAGFHCSSAALLM